jgi:hypothetical protein
MKIIHSLEELKRASKGLKRTRGDIWLTAGFYSFYGITD